MRRKSITKKTVSSTSAINPHGAGRESGGWPSDSSSNANLSADGDFEYAGRGVGSFFFFDPSLVTGRKNDNRSKNFAESTATVAAQSVAKNAVPTIAVGRADPAAARIAIAVAGMSCTELVLIARKVHIAFEATPGCGFNDSRSRIARNPSGVAALPSPEHVRRHVHQHRTHRGMVRRNFRKQSLHQRSQSVRDPLHKPGAFGQTHETQPQCHDPDQSQRDRHRCFCAIERAAGHILKPIVPTADGEPRAIPALARCNSARLLL